MSARDDAALGTGLATSPFGPGVLGVDLVLVSGQEGTTLGTVTGADNLAQCLRTALTTALGEDCFNIAFGFDGLGALTRALPRSQVADLLDLAVRQVLASDARIAQVLEVRTERGGDDGDPRVWSVRAMVQTVAGDTVNLGDGKVTGDG